MTSRGAGTSGTFPPGVDRHAERWQVTVEADAFVALCCLLAAAGVLRPRT